MAQQKSPLDRYRQFGDQLPDLDALHALQKGMRGALAWGALAEAHWCIDLAGASSKVKWIYEADQVLRRIAIEAANPLQNPDHATLRTEALITKIQLPTWRAIFTNDAAHLPSYSAVLEASGEIANVCRGSAKGVVKATEFVPVLLGYRATERQLGIDGKDLRWIGRTALLREDQRSTRRTIKMAGVSTHNWDTGATKDIIHPASLQAPPLKIQMKMGHEPKAGTYAGDITIMTARKVGTNNFRNIIEACIAEHRGSDDTPMTTSDLDALSHEVFASMNAA